MHDENWLDDCYSGRARLCATRGLQWKQQLNRVFQQERKGFNGWSVTIQAKHFMIRVVVIVRIIIQGRHSKQHKVGLQ